MVSVQVKSGMSERGDSLVVVILTDSIYTRWWQSIRALADDETNAMFDKYVAAAGDTDLNKFLDAAVKVSELESCIKNHKELQAEYVKVLNRIAPKHWGFLKDECMNVWYKEHAEFDSKDVGKIETLLQNLQTDQVNDKYMFDIMSSLAKPETEKSIGVRLYCKEYAEWESWLDYNDLSEQEQKELTDFLDAAPVQKNIEVNGKSFVLVHGGFSAKKSEILSMREEFWNHPVNKELLKEENLPDDSVVIFGHTTTRDISIEKSGLCEAYPKIFHDTDKIGIDCGACFPAGQLACLRLDDMKEFYVKNEETFITSLPRLNAFFLYNVTQYLV